MFLSPIALAKTAEDDFQQGLAAYEKQNYTQAALFMEKACNSNNALTELSEKALAYSN